MRTVLNERPRRAEDVILQSANFIKKAFEQSAVQVKLKFTAQMIKKSLLIVKRKRVLKMLLKRGGRRGYDKEQQSHGRLNT